MASVLYREGRASSNMVLLLRLESYLMKILAAGPAAGPALAIWEQEKLMKYLRFAHTALLQIKSLQIG